MQPKTLVNALRQSSDMLLSSHRQTGNPASKFRFVLQVETHVFNFEA